MIPTHGCRNQSEGFLEVRRGGIEKRRKGTFCSNRNALLFDGLVITKVYIFIEIGEFICKTHVIHSVHFIARLCF
jgi:hypothetical protein